MKRLKSSDDLASYGEKGVSKDWVRRDDDSSLHRSSSHRNFYYKPDNGKKGLSSSSSRYDRSEDDRESFRSTRKRTDYDVESYDRRKGYDRYRDGGERGIMSSSPRGGYGGDRIHRSESFSVPRREFPKGFRSERDRLRREGSVSSWRRFGSGKDVDDGGSRSGVDSARGIRATSDDIGKVRSPQGLRDAKSPSWSKDAKSPPWSKDSGSEQSKSVEVKKSEELPVESGNNSEMEEGELEPDPEPVPVLKHVAEYDASVGLNPNQDLNSDNIVEDKSLEDLASLSEEKVQLNQVSVPEEKAKIGMSEATPNVVKDVNELPGCVNTSVHKTSNDKDAIVTTADNEVANDGHCASENSNCPDGVSDMLIKPCPLDAEQKENKGIDLVVKSENIDLPGPIDGVADGNGASGVTLSFIDERENRSFKDKGKSLAVWPSSAEDAAEDSSRTETRSLLNFRENDMEGPSTRGFELFFTDPVKKLDKAEQSSLKPKDEKMALEPLELSLSLPNVLFPSSSQNTVQAPGSPSHARSVQSFTSSFRTSSDAFTASMSFSGSRPFSHNPSCSLTHNSFDNCEQSVGSRPIFQGVTWQGQSSNENTNKEGTMFQRILSNGNGLFHHSQTSQGISNGQAVQGQHHKVAEGSSKPPILDPQLSFNKQLTGVHLRHPNDVRSSSQSMGSHETGLDYRNDKNRVTREKNAVNMHMSNKQDEKEPLFAGGADFVDPIIRMIVSEPIHIMAKRFNEMTGQSNTNLKESVRGVILNPGKRWKLCGFQQALDKRSDITLEILLKSHRAQLEVLVALKTGLQDFLQRNYDISSSDLAEIFLNLRCRNLTCRSLLPVDECDCKICSQKNGFCSACMCLICSKFDNASNTCSWVGCDVCLHWCHAECGLRESYIRNGHSATRSQGTTEMQFHCVACDHPSEMFGFVKEVFQNFAKGWTAETISKELEYVRRIFRASEDSRGKRLHDIAVQMLTRLANKSDLQEVQSYIMALLTDSDSFKSSSTLIVPEKEIPKKKQGEGTTGITGSSQEAAWLKAVYSDKAPQLEKSVGLLPSFDFEKNDKLIANSDLQRSARKDPGFDELESIVRIKQAEAKMFQARADDARREAEGLKRIANAKNEKIEEEYTSRIRKLHLAEAEEIRRQKFEELQVLERAHQEYFNMKMRMETDIKDLLLKMEATKCNFTM